MRHLQIQTNKTCLERTKISYIPNIFTYSLTKKLFPASFLIALCSSSLLYSTGFSCSTKRNDGQILAKNFYKSNRSDLFDPLLLRREAASPYIRLLPLQRDKPLYKTDALTKQQPNRTHPTNIGLAQPSLSGNELQNKTLPSKEIAISLPVPPLSLAEKDKEMIPLPLQGTPPSHKMSPVAKNDPKTIHAINPIEPKKSILLAASQTQETCPSMASKSLSINNIFHADTALHEDISAILKYIEYFIKNQKRVRKDIQNIQVSNSINSIIGNIILKSENSRLSAYNAVLEVIEKLKKALEDEKKYHESNRNINPSPNLHSLFELVVGTFNRLKDAASGEYSQIDAVKKSVDEAIEYLEEHYQVLHKCIIRLGKEDPSEEDIYNINRLFTKNHTLLRQEKNKLLRLDDIENQLDKIISFKKEVTSIQEKLEIIQKDINIMHNTFKLIKNKYESFTGDFIKDIEMLKELIEDPENKNRSIGLIDQIIDDLESEKVYIKNIESTCFDNCINTNRIEIENLLENAVNIETQLKSKILSLTEKIIEEAEKNKERLKAIDPLGDEEA